MPHTIFVSMPITVPERGHLEEGHFSEVFEELIAPAVAENRDQFGAGRH